MAYLSLEFYAESLGRKTEVKVLLPNDTPPFITEGNPHYKRPMKSLYLLHGFSGINTDWLLNARVYDMAHKYNLAIILPSGENSFYLDRPGTGRKSGTFIGCELPDYMSKTLALSNRPEDKFIGGLSMGGFGALQVGLSHPERFSKIAAFSSALIVHEVAGMRDGKGNEVADYDYYLLTFGEPEKLLESKNNPEFLIRRLKAEGKQIPDLFITIGTEDFLYENNQEFVRFLEKEDVPFTYSEGPGAHDFDFWNAHLEEAIHWFLA